MVANARASRMSALCGAMMLSLAAHGSPGVVLLGDDHRGVIMRDVAAHERTRVRRVGDVYELEVPSAGVSLMNPVPGGAVTALADALHENDIGLVIVDATRGPTPEVREHILIARQARTPMLAMMLANVELLRKRAGEQAAELIDLEIRELRELLAAYDLDSESVRVFFDAPSARPQDQGETVGIMETLRALSLFGPKRAGAGELQRTGEIWSAVYLLTDFELGESAGTLSPNDRLVVWSEGTHSDATLISRTAYHPGDFREMPLSMDSPLEATEGSRILLVGGDRVLGVGVVTQIVRAP